MFFGIRDVIFCNPMMEMALAFSSLAAFGRGVGPPSENHESRPEEFHNAHRLVYCRGFKGTFMKLTISLLTIAILLTPISSASTFKVVYSFSFSDGSSPNGDLITDAAGNFYGTTQFGGKSNRGIVFELDAKGQQTILYTFTGVSDGGIPIGRLL